MALLKIYNVHNRINVYDKKLTDIKKLYNGVENIKVRSSSYNSRDIRKSFNLTDVWLDALLQQTYN